MPALTIRTTSGRKATLARADVDRLAAELRGELLTPDAPGYDDARRIWNAMVDRRPASPASRSAAATAGSRAGTG